ncbi:MAG: CbtA family protein [Nocardioides sp.]|uniref:CbtA family protein n=1 Tax=Nocardioides sp. TaxID=35761 RepID=UPI00238A7ABF|nr:CbtA family protein [Nocardioides sp.]MDE0778072.1 CbtA family protein [Nocardioides sp.]
MNARAFLVRGLLVGLLAGIAAFAVAYMVGEPHVERAIALEESGSAAADTEPTDHSHAAGTAPHSHGDSTGDGAGDGAGDGGASVSRTTQRTWGLATGTLAVGVALGGLVALVAAATVGRLGRLTPRQSTAVVALVGFTAVALVPFLKYPATPPAVGSGETIGARTGYYFVFLLISLVVGVAAVVVATRLWERLGAFEAVTIAAVGYVAVMVLAGELMPTVNEVGDYPADELWFFRRASLTTLVALWAVIGVGLTALVGRLHEQVASVAARRELAASL